MSRFRLDDYGIRALHAGDGALTLDTSGIKEAVDRIEAALSVLSDAWQAFPPGLRSCAACIVRLEPDGRIEVIFDAAT